MKIEDIDDSVIDRILKREEVTDDYLWDKFWSLTEGEARDYAKQRWFPDRDVKQNHITRKVKRFWPVIDVAVTRMRSTLQRDPGHPKVYRLYNYDYTAGGSLGFVMAGTRDEAKRLFDLFLPVTASEAGHSRFIDLTFTAPVEDARFHCALQNAAIAATMAEMILECQGRMREAVEKYETRIATIEARRDCFQILIASVGTGAAVPTQSSDSENIESCSDTVAEEVES